MNFLKNILLLSLIFLLACNEQSNPFIPGQNGASSDVYIYNLYMDGPARDFIILENVNIESFVKDQESIFRSCSESGNELDIMLDDNWDDVYIDYFNCNNSNPLDGSCFITIPECEDRYWCKMEGGNCISDNKDLLIVANEDENKGLLIYEIIEETNHYFPLRSG